MSEKRARQKRKQAMENKKQEFQFTFQHLENYISLHVILTGAKPETITLTPVVYNWFIQEAQRHADTLGLNPGFKNDEPVFNGIKILKKEETPKIETTSNPNNTK